MSACSMADLSTNQIIDTCHPAWHTVSLSHVHHHMCLYMYTAACMKVLMENAGMRRGHGTDKCLFEVVLTRNHCRPDPAWMLRADGNIWDTVKPLALHGLDLSRSVLLDDSPCKALTSELQNVVLLPTFHGCKDTILATPPFPDAAHGVQRTALDARGTAAATTKTTTAPTAHVPSEPELQLEAVEAAAGDGRAGAGLCNATGNAAVAAACAHESKPMVSSLVGVGRGLHSGNSEGNPTLEAQKMLEAPRRLPVLRLLALLLRVELLSMLQSGDVRHVLPRLRAALASVRPHPPWFIHCLDAVSNNEKHMRICCRPPNCACVHSMLATATRAATFMQRSHGGTTRSHISGVVVTLTTFSTCEHLQACDAPLLPCTQQPILQHSPNASSTRCRRCLAVPFAQMPS
jgi:hypothetical protein